MALHLHNTLSRKKELFEPLEADQVGMYVCGPTVYDRIHIGNARPFVIFDVLYRLLKRRYRKVTYVRNITDVDDKINQRAGELGVPIRELTEQTVAKFHDDVAAIGALPPDHEPRATDHVGAMIAMIGDLLEKQHAYVAEGHVLFSVPSMAEYGRLSGRNRDEMIAGARVEVAPYKKDAADFVLWKPSADDLPGWESPWGWGRPGWHIECSAMSRAFLGEEFDIHGGGVDLVFPHHENELAQSNCAHPGSRFVRYWVHNGYLMAEGEKMSKSLGNFYTVHDLLGEYPGEALRLSLLMTHYRQPMDFTKTGLQEARRVLDRLYTALRAAQDVTAIRDDLANGVGAALDDDLNTPLALREVMADVQRLNKSLAEGDDEAIGRDKGRLLAGAAILGLGMDDAEGWFKRQGSAGDGLDAVQIEAMIEARVAAREARDFAEADRIRDALTAGGVVLEDRAGGTIWRRAG